MTQALTLTQTPAETPAPSLLQGESALLAWTDLAWSVVLVAVLVLLVNLLIPVAHAKARPAPPAPIFPALRSAASVEPAAAWLPNGPRSRPVTPRESTVP